MCKVGYLKSVRDAMVRSPGHAKGYSCGSSSLAMLCFVQFYNRRLAVMSASFV